MSNNLDLLRIYYNLFCDDKTFMDTLHYINGDQYWDSECINDIACKITNYPCPNVNAGNRTDPNYANSPNFIDRYEVKWVFVSQGI